MLSLLLLATGQTRARISEKTIRILSKRQRLRVAFIAELIVVIDDYGWVLVELPSGGFGAVQLTAIEAAKPVTISRFMPEDLRREWRKAAPDFNRLQAEFDAEMGEPDLDD